MDQGRLHRGRAMNILINSPDLHYINTFITSEKTNVTKIALKIWVPKA
jgi:hypothetical protein